MSKIVGCVVMQERGGCRKVMWSSSGEFNRGLESVGVTLKGPLNLEHGGPVVGLGPSGVLYTVRAYVDEASIEIPCLRFIGYSTVGDALFTTG